MSLASILLIPASVPRSLLEVLNCSVVLDIRVASHLLRLHPTTHPCLRNPLPCSASCGVLLRFLEASVAAADILAAGLTP